MSTWNFWGIFIFSLPFPWVWDKILMNAKEVILDMMLSWRIFLRLGLMILQSSKRIPQPQGRPPVWRPGHHHHHQGLTAPILSCHGSVPKGLVLPWPTREFSTLFYKFFNISIFPVTQQNGIQTLFELLEQMISGSASPAVTRTTSPSLCASPRSLWPCARGSGILPMTTSDCASTTLLAGAAPRTGPTVDPLMIAMKWSSSQARSSATATSKIGMIKLC